MENSNSQYEYLFGYNPKTWSQSLSPEQILILELSPVEFLLYNLFAVRSGGGFQKVSLTLDQIVLLTNLSKSTVQKTLRALSDKKMISKEIAPVKGGTYVYTLLYNPKTPLTDKQLSQLNETLKSKANPEGIHQDAEGKWIL